MKTCPDCGSLIMEGDPYCSHCGAHLSGSDYSDYRPDSTRYSCEELLGYAEESREYERRHQEMLKKLSDCYKVELDDLDVKDGYIEYLFSRKTPYYTLKMVATDQYGDMIGVKRDSIRVDFSDLLQIRRFRKLMGNSDFQLNTNLYRDEIGVNTNGKSYILDTDNMKLIEREQDAIVRQTEKYCPKCGKAYDEEEYRYCPICSTELAVRQKNKVNWSNGDVLS